MKKLIAFYILALLTGVLLNIAAYAATFNANNTADATFEGVAATSGYKNTFDQIIINVGDDGPDTVTVKCGSTTKLGPYYLGANSGLVLTKSYELPDPLVQCAANEALNFTKGVAGTKVTVSGQYQLRK